MSDLVTLTQYTPKGFQNKTVYTLGGLVVTDDGFSITLDASGVGGGAGAAAAENLGNDIIDDGSGNLTIAHTAVIPGSYTATNLTVNAEGRITAASNGSSGGVSYSTYPQAATTGTLAGELWYEGNFTSSGAITAQSLKLFVHGNFTLNHNITVATELAGGSGLVSSPGSFNSIGAPGQGLGGGFGGSNDGNAGGDSSGTGGGFGGLGGSGGTADSAQGVGIGGQTYNILRLSCGSGGGAGGTTAANLANQNPGGAGGGGILIYATGNILINGNIVANGGAGIGIGDTGHNNGSGAGGSGGAVQLLAGGTLTINSGKTVSANGGSGGTGGTQVADGPGGGGGVIKLRGSSVTTSGATVQALGGIAPTSGTSVAIAATNGGAGIIDSVASPVPAPGF